MNNNRITPLSGELNDTTFDYFHNDVEAVIRVSGEGENKRVAIMHWESHNPGNGNTNEALKWMREHYGSVNIHGAGCFTSDGNPDNALSYWKHQKEKGLVDNLYLNNGVLLETPKKKKMTR